MVFCTETSLNASAYQLENPYGYQVPAVTDVNQYVAWLDSDRFCAGSGLHSSGDHIPLFNTRRGAQKAT